jgi:glycosyltransferase involved in cell wall biosynthesis
MNTRQVHPKCQEPRLIQPSNCPILCIVDPNLRDFVGHHFAYDHAVVEAAHTAGFKPLLLGHRSLPEEIAREAGARGAFSDDIWARVRRGGPLMRRLDGHRRNHRFAGELRRALPSEAWPPGSVLFAHMLTGRQLLGLAKVAESLPRHVTTIALLRYEPEMLADSLSARGFARIRHALAGGARIRLASDSTRLAQRLTRLAGLPVEVLPIPHITSDLPPPAAGTDRPMHMVSLGNAREEKGFLELLKAIALLRAEPQGLAGLRFTLQTNDASNAVQAALDAFAIDLPDAVRLLPMALTPADYSALLIEADLVLLPYWREIYEARTSGVLPEALAAGRPVICTAETWMADELALHGAGLLVPDHDAPALAQAIRAARAQWPTLAAQARAGRESCIARHGGAALMQALRSPQPPPPQQPPRRVQIFYPWTDFAERAGGASLRCNLMADVVASEVEEVRVMQTGSAAPSRHGNILIESMPEPAWASRARRWLRQGFRLLCFPLVGRKYWGEEVLLWRHLESALDPFLRRNVRRLLAGSDAVLLEYGFWAPTVLAESHRLGIPCVLTLHDVIEDGVTGSPLLRSATAWFERRARRAADLLVAVAPGDAERFRTEGRHPVVIPNTVDLGLLGTAPPEGRTTLPAGPFCLFVGSHFPPNIQAVAQLRRMAALLADQPAALVVVVGSVAAPEEAPGFLALGKLPANHLAELYRRAALAVIPLQAGTGASLKTLEAMAAGLPVLGTRLAFRGLPIPAELEAAMEDDLSRWPARIRRLMDDPAERHRLGSAGRKLAEAYGHRCVMRAYLPLLGLVDATPGGSDTLAR